MAWVLLGLAGLFEIVWASFMKQSAGFTKLVPSLITVAAMIASFWLLSASLRTLPLGTAYAIWTGIGAVGAFIVGVAFMGEALTPARLLSVSLLLAGMIGLKLSSGV